MKSEELLIIEASIIKLVESDGKTVHFDYHKFKEFEGEEDYFSAAAVSYNSATNSSFLIKKVSYKRNFEIALNEILDYMINMKVSSRSYTVCWEKIEKGHLGSTNTSYFYCKNAKEVIEKFYHGKIEEEYNISLLHDAGFTFTLKGKSHILKN